MNIVGKSVGIRRMLMRTRGCAKQRVEGNSKLNRTSSHTTWQHTKDRCFNDSFCFHGHCTKGHVSYSRHKFDEVSESAKEESNFQN